MQKEQIFEHLSKEAQKIGISEWDLSGSSSLSTSVAVMGGKVDKIQTRDALSFGLRVMTKESFGYISSSDLSGPGLSKALKLAKDIAELRLTDTSPHLTASSMEKFAIPERKLAPETDVRQLSQKLLEMEREVLKADPAFKKIPYNGIGEYSGKRFYLNSIGSMREESFQNSWVYLYLLAEAEGKKARKTYCYEQALSFADLQISKCVQDTINNGKFVLDYVPASTGKRQVCFHPKAFLTLLSAFSNIWNARLILDGKSLVKKDQIGATFASPSFSLVDSPRHPFHLNPVWFDDEGVKAQEMSIFEGGVLRNLVHNEETARAFDKRATGNAISGPRSSASHHYLSVPAGTRDQDWGEEQGAVYVEELHALHAGIQSLQGSFSLPFDGQIAVDGKKRSIESGLISGDILSLLQNIVSIGKTCEVTTAGYAPKIWVDEISVTAG